MSIWIYVDPPFIFGEPTTDRLHWHIDVISGDIRALIAGKSGEIYEVFLNRCLRHK